MSRRHLRNPPPTTARSSSNCHGTDLAHWALPPIGPPKGTPACRPKPPFQQSDLTETFDARTCAALSIDPPPPCKAIASTRLSAAPSLCAESPCRTERAARHPSSLMSQRPHTSIKAPSLPTDRGNRCKHPALTEGASPTQRSRNCPTPRPPSTPAAGPRKYPRSDKSPPGAPARCCSKSRGTEGNPISQPARRQPSW